MRFNLGQKSQPPAINCGCVLELLLLRETEEGLFVVSVLKWGWNHCLLFNGARYWGEETRGEKRSISIAR